MSDGLRQVSLERTSKGRLVAHNERGATLALGMGEDGDFTPVELLLVAIAGCAAIDVDLITGKRSAPEEFRVDASGSRSGISTVIGWSSSASTSRSGFLTTTQAGRPKRSCTERSVPPMTDSARSAGQSKWLVRSR